jgi:hypothetical protein
MNKTELLNRLNKILTQLTQKDVSSAKADLTVLIVDVKHTEQERTVTTINRKIHHVDGGW